MCRKDVEQCRTLTRQRQPRQHTKIQGHCVVHDDCGRMDERRGTYTTTMTAQTPSQTNTVNTTPAHSWTPIPTTIPTYNLMTDTSITTPTPNQEREPLPGDHSSSHVGTQSNKHHHGDHPNSHVNNHPNVQTGD